jgi:hypothetical protein
VGLGAVSAVLLAAYTGIEGRLRRTADEAALAEQSLRLESTLAQRIVRLVPAQQSRLPQGGTVTGARVVALLQQAASQSGMSAEALTGMAPAWRRSEGTGENLLTVTVKLSGVTRKELVLFLSKVETGEARLFVERTAMSRRAPTQTRWDVELVVSAPAPSGTSVTR